MDDSVSLTWRDLWLINKVLIAVLLLLVLLDLKTR
jgi:hypothetical protein